MAWNTAFQTSLVRRWRTKSAGGTPRSTTLFRTVSAALGTRLERIPDGETGARADFIGWQSDLFKDHPQFELSGDVGRYNPRPRSRLRTGVRRDDVVFDRLGYAEAAIASFAVFSRLQRMGVIPESTRFQVCLPSPLAPVQAWVIESDQAAVRPAYVRRMLAEVDEIAAEVPHERLAVQWDVASEMLALERMGDDPALAPSKAVLWETLAGAGNRVPVGVELGYHLCYGDFGHQHALQPRDTGRLVEMANGILARLERPLDWLHLPVPRDRDDAAYFAPLANLRLSAESALYLGLLHLSDRVAGAQRRMAAASTQVTEFGVATECGWGRRDAASVSDLLRLHAEVIDRAPDGNGLAAQ